MEEASREEKEENLSSGIPKQRGKITKSFDRITFNSDFDSGVIFRQQSSDYVELVFFLCR